MADDKDKKKNGEDDFGFGHGRSAADVFDEQHDFDSWMNNRDVSWSRPGEGSYAEEQWEKDQYRQFSANRARSAATGAWAARANEHAAKLYNEHQMDYNDMRKYGKLAGVSDINSENDVNQIVDAYKNAHTTQDELDAAFEKFEPKDSEAEGATNPTPADYDAGIVAAKERVQNFQANRKGAADQSQAEEGNHNDKKGNDANYELNKKGYDFTYQ